MCVNSSPLSIKLLFVNVRQQKGSLAHTPYPLREGLAMATMKWELHLYVSLTEQCSYISVKNCYCCMVYKLEFHCCNDGWPPSYRSYIYPCGLIHLNLPNYKLWQEMIIYTFFYIKCHILHIISLCHKLQYQHTEEHNHLKNTILFHTISYSKIYTNLSLF